MKLPEVKKKKKNSLDETNSILDNEEENISEAES